jgi:hypothetical protein
MATAFEYVMKYVDTYYSFNSKEDMDSTTSFISTDNAGNLTYPPPTIITDIFQHR